MIAIIAILASMLLPALNRARDKATAVKCVSNQKQTMLAQLQYSNDFAGHMVVTAAYGNSFEPWTTLLTREKANTALLPQGGGYLPGNTIRCPGNKIAGEFDRFWGNYGFLKNSLTAERKQRMGDFVIVRSPDITFLVTRMKSPTRTPLLADTVASGSSSKRGNSLWYWGPDGPADTSGGHNGGIHCGHNSRSTTGFADGHVEAMTSRQLFETGMKIKFTVDGALQPHTLSN